MRMVGGADLEPPLLTSMAGAEGIFSLFFFLSGFLLLVKFHVEEEYIIEEYR